MSEWCASKDKGERPFLQLALKPGLYHVMSSIWGPLFLYTETVYDDVLSFLAMLIFVHLYCLYESGKMSEYKGDTKKFYADKKKLPL